MLIGRAILAAVAVAAVGLRPRGTASVVIAGAAGAVDVLLGTDIGPAIDVVAPLAAFLTAAVSLAVAVQRSGLCDRVAGRLAYAARGRGWVLYVLVCGLCALLTAVVSLDGAVVLIVSFVLALHRRFAAPLAPLLVGTVAVANVASIAVPQGNPTNLIVMDRLGVSPVAFLAHMLLPGIVAAAACAAAVALSERRALKAPIDTPAPNRAPLSASERHAVLALAASALAAWVAPLAGIPPWWPFAAVVAAALAVSPAPTPPVFPWRIVAQVAGLVVVVHGLGLRAPVPTALGPIALIGVALAAGTAAALANNLPASVWAASLLGAGPLAYAATIGLGVGALATPQGSVATLIAADLVSPDDAPLSIGRLAPLAAGGLLIACVLLSATLW
jgi:arsenical pump membrane protein